MKDLNDCDLIYRYNESEIPMFIVSNLSQDLELVFKRYVSFEKYNFDFKIKILSGNRYVIEVKCLTDFLLANDNF